MMLDGEIGFSKSETKGAIRLLILGAVLRVSREKSRIDCKIAV